MRSARDCSSLRVSSRPSLGWVRAASSAAESQVLPSTTICFTKKRGALGSKGWGGVIGLGESIAGRSSGRGCSGSGPVWGNRSRLRSGTGRVSGGSWASHWGVWAASGSIAQPGAIGPHSPPDQSRDPRPWAIAIRPNAVFTFVRFVAIARVTVCAKYCAAVNHHRDFDMRLSNCLAMDPHGSCVILTIDGDGHFCRFLGVFRQ